MPSTFEEEDARMLKARITELEFEQAPNVASERALSEPVTITKQGRDHLVLMSADQFERLMRSAAGNGAGTDIVSDPVLVKFKWELEALYGHRLERAVLFGSRARGDARPDSDYDVAVFLHDLRDRDAEVDRLAELQSRLMDATDAFVHALPFPAGAWSQRLPLMLTLRTEGKEL